MKHDSTTTITIQQQRAGNSVAGIRPRSLPDLSNETTIHVGFIDGADTVSITHRRTTQAGERDLFIQLADWWHELTDSIASPARKIAQTPYRRIIEKGESMVPYILEDLRDRGGYWFAALEQIEHFTPVPKDAEPGFDVARDMWLSWGRAKHLIDQ